MTGQTPDKVRPTIAEPKSSHQRCYSRSRNPARPLVIPTTSLQRATGRQPQEVSSIGPAVRTRLSVVTSVGRVGRESRRGVCAEARMGRSALSPREGAVKSVSGEW
eukprot:scaffold192860_cov37-Tisochrysis_lutea.AAC.5